MLEIKKSKTEFGYWFDIYTDDGCFKILFGGNGDLYFDYSGDKGMLESDDSKVIYITKENYFLFSLFEQLYKDVKDYNVYKPDDFIDELTCQEWREDLIEADLYNPIRLFHDNKIEWFSDDFHYDEASSLVMEKLSNRYKLTFNKSKDNNYLTYSIRVRNSGSRYQPFNRLFRNLYKDLCLYDPNYHQIHMEEYLY